MKPAVFLVLLIGVTIIVLNLIFIWQLQAPLPNHPVVEYKDFAAILLTAVAVIVAVLAMAVAIIAIWGYNDVIRRTEAKADESAAKVAGKAVETHLKSREFVEAVQTAVNALVEEQVRAGLTTANAGPSGPQTNVTGTAIPPAP
ncbi:MAG: hypothetical protein J0H44_11675 [Alphaproteobacteria bacterium]|nr:hypothetical protein [Alphaproteobacteria bacterium]